MRAVVAPAEVTRGKLLLTDQAQLRRDVAQLRDGAYDLVIRPRESKGAIRQMQKYWHAVPVEVCRHDPKIGGLQHMPMHYALLGEFRGYLEGPFGHQVPVVASSSELGKEGWKQLIDWVLDWGPSEHGVLIPEPSSREARALVDEYHRAGGHEEAA